MTGESNGVGETLAEEMFEKLKVRTFNAKRRKEKT